MSVTGMVSQIETFSVHDGPGIRSVVFLKGCPLRCRWCHSPETRLPVREILFRKEKCVLCGACSAVCPRDCRKISGGRHVFDRSGCIGCGLCAERCPANALRITGKEMTVRQVLDAISGYKMFYDESGGGMTISGGEPLFQPEFTGALLKEAARRGISGCVETCGHGDYADLKLWIPYTKKFLYDYKATDPERHRELTGVDNRTILANLKRLNDAGADITLRCPLIPGVNDSPDHLLGIARTADRLKNIRAVDLEPGNPLTAGKYEQLGLAPPADCICPAETVEFWRAAVAAHTGKPVTVQNVTAEKES